MREEFLSGGQTEVIQTPRESVIETGMPHEIHHHKHHHKHESEVEEKQMATEIVDVGGGMGGAGAGLGAGLGGGLLGGILAGALFGNGGLNRAGAVGEGVVTPSQLTAGLAGVTDALQTTTVMQSLGDIKASVPLAESQVQLALAGTQSEITSQINTSLLATLQGQNLINKNVSDAIAASLASQNNLNVNILQTGTANLMATKDSQFALSNLITADGEKTRALITANQISELQRLAAERQDEIIELRNSAARDRDRSAIEITMTNNQNQNQMQFQQQAQALVTLGHCLADVSQLARATNTNLIVGNAGATTTGAQTANPVNVKA